MHAKFAGKHITLPVVPVAILGMALLAGCGGGGGDSPPAVATVTPATPTTTPTTPATPAAPTATGDTATDGFAWFNYRRSQIGLSTLTRNTLIDTAAGGHSNYLRLNNTVSHEQVSGSPGFTGVTLVNRLTAAGYTLTGSYAAGEVISAAGDRSGFFHAEELITAIYHRFAIFQPVFREIGTGASSTANYTYFTADFATTNGYGPGVGRGNVVVYPASGQTGVPVNFMSDSESPDPVPNQNEVGYPISVHADISTTVLVTAFTVKPRGGDNLPVRLLSAATDADTQKTSAAAAAIVPLVRLAANTTYDVSFSGSVDSAAVTRNWSFTTK
ncbi:uncharacterized protein YkwD [Pseudoduganella lurida]|uniref:Uncharacterized protein YkwD n=1 Tax=Pseudoduganella lurida TaxID=1036180 RepID=A0A562QUZ8_9BURK|nr:CAP domain-containing protein [Pseudoduganella lurida]TWI60612.1 uncharacterized protein YkwD [Pseudoduganella lurida]